MNPESQPNPLQVVGGKRRARWIRIGVLVVIALGLLYVRKPDSLRNPQFWAEDGTLFFAQEYSLGAQAHLEPYAGYFHEVPRIVASIAGLFPYSAAPAVYNYSTLLVSLLLVPMVFSRRLELGSPTLLALVPFLVPHLQGDVFLNLTNIQWFLALLLLLTALKQPPKTKGDCWLDGSLIVLCGLTGPFIVLLLPIFGIRGLRHRSGTAWASLVLAVLVASIQLVTFLGNPVVLSPDPGRSSESWAQLVGQKAVGNLFLGHRVPYSINPWWLIVAGLVLVCYLAWNLSQSKVGREFGLPVLYFGLAVLLLAFFKFRFAPNLLVPPAAATRYFYLPYVAITWCLLLVAMSKPMAHRVIATALALAILASSLRSGFTNPPLPDRRWHDHASLIEAPRSEPLVIPINPRGWQIVLPAASSD